MGLKEFFCFGFWSGWGMGADSMASGSVVGFFLIAPFGILAGFGGALWTSGEPGCVSEGAIAGEVSCRKTEISLFFSAAFCLVLRLLLTLEISGAPGSLSSHMLDSVLGGGGLAKDEATGEGWMAVVRSPKTMTLKVLITLFLVVEKT